MPNWKKVVVSGSSAALSNLTVDNALTASGLIYPTADGTSGQTLTTDGNGNLTFSSVSGFVDGTGAVNKVAFWTDTDTISNDTNLHWDSSNDRLGIGTSSPSAPLHIVEDSTGDALLIESTNGGADATPVITLKRNSPTPADGDYLGQIKFKGENDADQEIVYAKITGKTSDVTDATEDGLIETAVKKDGTNVIVSRQTSTDLKLINGTGLQVDGNVGIGTTSPDKPLHISNTDPTLRLQDSDGTNQWGQIRQAGANLVLTSKNDTSNGQIVFQTYDGTTTVDTLTLKTNNQALLSQYGSGTYTGTAAYTLAVDSSGNIIEESLGAGAVDGTGTANYITRWEDSDTITSSSIYEDSSGNIGIGTITPGSKLEVNNGNLTVTGSGVRQINLESTNDEVRFGLKGNNGNAFRFTSDGTHFIFKDATKERIKFTNAGDTTFGGRDSGGNQATWMTLEDQTGYVGIGTDTPAVRLDVSGSIYASGKTAWNGGGSESDKTDIAIVIDENDFIYTRDDSANLRRLIGKSSSDVIEIGQNGTQLIDNIDLMPGSTGNVRIVATTEYVRFDGTNKRVGIGTSSPTALLHLSSGTDGDAVIKIEADTDNSNENDNPRIEFSQDGGLVTFDVGLTGTAGNEYYESLDNAGYIGTTSDLPVQIIQNDSASLTVDTGGNIGIGTTSPATRLHLFSSSSAAPTLLTLHNYQPDINPNGSQGNFIDFKMTDDNATFTPQVRIGMIVKDTDGDEGMPSEGTGNFVVYTAEGTDSSGNGTLTEHLRITDKGKVGIGTTSPSYKLDISGDLRVLSSSISYQENTDVDSAAAETVATVVIADFDAAFFDYVIKSGTNLRAGTVTAVHDGTNVEYNEVSTQDLGDTSDVSLSVDISGTDMRLRATTTSDNWEIKSLVRTI